MAPPGNPLTLQDTPDLYANMTSYVAKDRGNIKLVSPGKPGESALIKILQGPCAELDSEEASFSRSASRWNAST